MSIPRSRPVRLLLALFVMAVLPAGLVACGGDDGGGDSAAASAGAGADTTEPVTLRLGYFPNITHATALVGVENGFFDDALADNVTLETSTFNAGPEAVEALFADALDATYIGPNPAINAYAQSDGEAIRIVSGATSGGAFLVVRDGIDAPEDLAGTTLASPQLANTQDVALRAWLQEEGYETDESGGGDVSITPQANADTLAAFQAGNIDGAWVPEPWATRLIQEGGGHVLVDERDLWPEGQYVTTHLIVRTEFLNDHPDVVKQLLEGQVAANEFVNANPAEAQALVNRGIEAATGKPIAEGVITAAWENLTFTDDPIASSLQESAADAESLGLLDPVDLDGIYDLSLLNEVLTAKGLDEVQGL